MKTNELVEKESFFGIPNWERAYPQLYSPEFYNQARNHWQNLNANKLCMEFRPVRGTINEFTMFYLWIYLCMERPWEKNWSGNFTQKKADKIWNIFYKLFDQVSEDDLPEPDDLPNPPDPRSLRKYIKRDDFQRIVTWTTMDPFVFKKITEAFAAFCKPLKKLNYYIDDLKLNFKFANYIRLQRHIKKRDLMRKLGINERDCDLLLTEAVSQNFVRVEKFPNNSVWVIYNRT